MIRASSEVVRTAHALRMMGLTSGTVAELPSDIVPALQRSPEQQSTLQVPFFQSLLYAAVLHFSAEKQSFLKAFFDDPSSSQSA